MTKKIYLETFEKCAGPLCFTLLIFYLFYGMASGIKASLYKNYIDNLL